METKRVICSICESEFWTRGNRAKYCSPECRKDGILLRKIHESKSREGWRRKKASQHKL